MVINITPKKDWFHVFVASYKTNIASKNIAGFFMSLKHSQYHCYLEALRFSKGCASTDTSCDLFLYIATTQNFASL